MERYLPLFVMEKLLKRAGAKRISEHAKIELKTHLERKAVSISEKAILFADHAGRKTVKNTDIKISISD